MSHPKWLTELDKSLSDDQQTLLSTNLRAALAKATVQSTDNEHTLGIAREIAVVALTELTPVAIANTHYRFGSGDLKTLTAHIERWQQTKRTTSANTDLVQAMRADAGRHKTDPIGQTLWASARLICWSHSVNYKNPRSRIPSLRIGTMPKITADFLTVCLAAKKHDRACVDRGINTVVDVINELF